MPRRWPVAGVTMFNSCAAAVPNLVTWWRSWSGGLGHLGSVAVKMGFRTAVIARGREKAGWRCGSVRTTTSTPPRPTSPTRCAAGWGAVVQANRRQRRRDHRHGRWAIPLRGTVDPRGTDRPARGQPATTDLRPNPSKDTRAGTREDVEDTLNFAALHNIRPWSNKFPSTTWTCAYQRMLAQPGPIPHGPHHRPVIAAKWHGRRRRRGPCWRAHRWPPRRQEPTGRAGHSQQSPRPRHGPRPVSARADTTTSFSTAVSTRRRCAAPPPARRGRAAS